MPIKKFQNDALSLPMVARLRKGGEMRTSKSGKQMPGKDLEHFRVEFEERFEYMADVFYGLYGTEPDCFPGVELTGFTAEAAFPHWMEEWGNGTLKRRCDGEKQVGGFDAGQPCAASCHCSGVGRLSFRLPAMEAATGFIGSYLIATTSMYDIAHIAKRIASAEKLYGTLDGVQFVIGREKRSMQSKDKNGKSVKSTKSLIYIEIDPDWSAQQMTTSSHRDMAAPQNTAHWTAQPDRVQGLLQWAHDRFKMSPEDVLIALKNAYDTVTVITDFPGDEIEAVAAVVASHCQYNPQQIQSIEKVSSNVKRTALTLAALRADAAETQHEGDGAYDFE